MLRKCALLILFILSAIALAVPWTMNFSLTSGDNSFTITAGINPDATDGYDSFDENIPLAPPSGPYAFSAIDDPDNPYIDKLSVDIRNDDDTQKIWNFELRRGEIPQVISWNRYLIPTAAGDYYIGFAYPGLEVDAWVSMRSTSAQEFLPGQIAYFRFDPSEVTGNTPPSITRFTPADGDLNIPTNTPIVIQVEDAETGIDFESIVFNVNDINIIDEATVDFVVGGYRLEYSPETMWSAMTEYEVTFYAEDISDETYSVEASHTFETGAAILPADWEIPLSAWVFESGDTSVFEVYLGQDADASSTFDLGYDIVFPVAPPGESYAYFPFSDEAFPYFTMLTRDIRSLASLEEYWQIKLEAMSYNMGIRWNTFDIPDDITLYIAAEYAPFMPSESDWVEMSSVSNLTILPGQVIHVYSVLELPDNPPYLVSVTPPNGSSNISPETSIQIVVRDNETEINEESILFYVEDEDITEECEFSVEGNTITIDYTPFEIFDPMTTINWHFYCQDYAVTPNDLDVYGNFTTGYYTPEWEDTLIIETDLDSDSPYYSYLIFGADNEATDRFDYGFDIQVPPAPPGFNTYAYFEVDDPLFTQLSQDIRSSEDTYTLWRASINNIDTTLAAYQMSWNTGILPEEGEFSLLWSPIGVGDEVWLDMREASSLEFYSMGTVEIQYSLYPTYRVFGNIYLEDSEEISGTQVVLDDTLFTSTNNDGYFVFYDVLAGSHSLEITRDDYLPITHNFELIDSDYEFIDTLNISPIHSTLYFNVTLNDTADDLSGTNVIVDEVISVYTDETGTATIPEISFGSHSVTISREHYGIYNDSIEVSLLAHEYDIALTKFTGNVSGTVVDNRSNPLEGAMVEIDSFYTFTNSEGYYLIENVMYGTRSVHAAYGECDDYIYDLTIDSETVAHDIILTCPMPSLNPPLNFTPADGMHNRIACSWDVPEESDAILTGYKIYRENLFGDDELVGTVPDYCTCYIYHDPSIVPSRYYATAVYVEGESEGSNYELAFSGENDADPDILIYDFDDGADLANNCSVDESNMVNSLLGRYRYVTDITDDNASLAEYDLLDYQMVWLVTGVDDAEFEVIPNDDLAVLRSYIAGGGRIYWEGADAGYDYGRGGSGQLRRQFFDMFGAVYVADGRSSADNGNVVELYGSESFFQEGPVTMEYDHLSMADQRVDEFLPLGATTVMNSQEVEPAPLESTVRMLAYAPEEANYRSVLSSVYVGAMRDTDSFNQRSMVTAWILNYLLEPQEPHSEISEHISSAPEQMDLVNAYPNPFNSNGYIEYTVPAESDIEIDMYDLKGNFISNIISGHHTEGVYNIRIETSNFENMSTGLYLIKLKANDFTSSERILLIK